MANGFAMVQNHEAMSEQRSKLKHPQELDTCMKCMHESKSKKHPGKQQPSQFHPAVFRQKRGSKWVSRCIFKEDKHPDVDGKPLNFSIVDNSWNILKHHLQE